MNTDESLTSVDPVAVRDREREAEARWFLVGADTKSMYMVDRQTLQRRSALRTGWAMAIGFDDGKLTMRAAIHEVWDCARRSETKLTIQTYDGEGAPDPIQTMPARAEPIIPDTVGEEAFNFVCDREPNGEVYPMPVSRDPLSAAQILAAYVQGSEVTVLGLLLATLDPWKDEERLHSLLSLTTAEKRPRLMKLIWNGLR